MEVRIGIALLLVVAFGIGVIIAEWRHR